jgi:glycosyltransferase involved in cell wall biosynthesis
LAEAAVTAVIPVRDGEAYLAEAIESVLAQSRAPDQVIVVDNDSSDRSVEIARGYGPAIEIVFEPRHGIGPARNAALRAARGSHIAFLDADDLWQREKTALQLDAFAADSDLGAVFGHVRQFVSSDLAAEEAAALRIPNEPQPGLYLGAMMARREVIDAIGPWPEESKVSDGLTFMLSLRELGVGKMMLPETVTLRRVHGANHSIRNRSERKEFAQMLKRSLDRRREAAGEQAR